MVKVMWLEICFWNTHKTECVCGSECVNVWSSDVKMSHQKIVNHPLALLPWLTLHPPSISPVSVHGNPHHHSVVFIFLLLFTVNINIHFYNKTWKHTLPVGPKLTHCQQRNTGRKLFLEPYPPPPHSEKHINHVTWANIILTVYIHAFTADLLS